MTFKFAHTNFNVLNLDRSLKFYKEALGLVEQRRIENPNFTIVYVGNDASDFQLELTWLKDRKEPYNLGEKHEDMGCIVFENKAMGIYFIADPDGYWLEVIPVR